MSAIALSCNSIQAPKLTDVIEKVKCNLKKLEEVGKLLIGSYCAELAEAKTRVRRVVSDLKLIQHEAEVVISIATLKGEDGARTPSQVAEAKRQLFASFRTEEQTEFNRYRHAVASRYNNLQELLDKLDKEGSSMTRAEKALLALEKKTKPIPGWQKWLHRIGIAVTAVAAAGCVIAIGTGVTAGAGGGLAFGAGALVFVSILTTYRYTRVTDASADKHHKDAVMLQETLAGAKYNLAEVGDIRIHFCDFEQFGKATINGIDQIESVFKSRFGSLEEGTAECQKALPSLKENTETLDNWAEEDAS